ncbi:MAG TPA: hypothetical protein VFP55_11420, partial [Solirubrobacteraceae bacterium]|nr:hypothetical protein [Solirubrobacteraceae bacterium]
MVLLLELLLAPGLVAVSILAGRRGGERVSGLVSAFPAVVGPVLLIVAQAHGAAFAARSADATLLGLTTLAAFTVAYARLARTAHWSACLAGGWAAAIGVGLLLRWLAPQLTAAAGLLVA